MDVRVAADPAGAAVLAAATIARRLRAAVRSRGRASLAVSGGSTPALMLDELAGRSLPWDRIVVLQVDERIAPAGDRARNATQLTEQLLDRLPVLPAAVELLPVESLDLEAAARRLHLLEPLDVVHLGVGDDGHTASWPPADPAAEAALASASGIALVRAFRGYDRLSLTPAVVGRARARVVLVTGADKAAIVARWLGGDRRLPISQVRRSATVVVLDVAAAAGLRR